MSMLSISVVAPCINFYIMNATFQSRACVAALNLNRDTISKWHTYSLIAHTLWPNILNVILIFTNLRFDHSNMYDDCKLSTDSGQGGR